jgi:chitinase
MKKIFLAFILLASLFLVACNGTSTGEITVNIYDSESNVVTKVVEISKESNLLNSLEETDEISFIIEEGLIQSVNGIEAKDNYNWQVYLNDVLVVNLGAQVIKDKDIVEFKQVYVEKITVEVIQNGQEPTTYLVPLNGNYLLSDVLISFDELKVLIADDKVISVLDVTLQEGNYWQIKKNNDIVDNISSISVSDGDIIKISSLENDFFNVIIQNINTDAFSKKVYMNGLNIIETLTNDQDIKLIYNNNDIESIKNINLEEDYKWVIYLNEEIIDSLENLTINNDDELKFVVEENITINVEVYNGDSLIYEASINTDSLNLLTVLTSDSELAFNYQEGVIKYVRSIYPKKNFQWEILSNGSLIEDIENHIVSANEEVSIRLVYVPIIVDFEVSFSDVEFRVGNVIGYSIKINSGPSLGAKVTSSSTDVLEVNGLNLYAKARGDVMLLIEIGDSKQSFELSVGFKRYEDMSDEEYMALSPEEQDQVWEEHLAYQAELRHLEVERIVEFANNLPTEVSEDIELILGTLVPSVWVSWESNFPGSISNTGKVMKKTYDTVVTLTLTVWSTEESVSVSREILVKGFDMEPLPINNLTFAYLPPYNFQGFKEEDIKKVDVINFAAGSIGASHQLVITSTNVFFELLKLREQGLKIVVCVQGGSWFSDPYTTIFEDMAINPENRAAFVQSVVDAIEMYDFDGIDIDWEIPAPNNAQYFTALVRDLREAFDKINPELIVSAAVPNSNLSSNFEYDKIGQYMDYLHLMNYDLGWKERTSHNSVLYSGSNNTYLDLSVDKTVNVFKSLGFPKEKMVIGSAFYGKIYKNVFTSGNGLGVSVTGADNQAKTINYHDVYNNYLTVNPQYIRRDEIAHADYYYDNVNGIFITYESFNVLREKTQYVVDNELAGIMFWDYNQDQTGDLLQAIYQTYPTR